MAETVSGRLRPASLFYGGVLFKKDDVTFQFQQREAFERGLGETTIRLREKSAKQ